jgi:hypothetical protein
MGRKQVFPGEGENDLAEHCLLVERKFLGLTVADVMRLSYQFAVRNGIKNQSCTRNEKTGRKWLKNFLHCHQEIQLQPLKDFTLKSEGLQSCISSSVFLNLRSRYVHHKHNPARLQLRRNRRHYCTAQTRENFRIKRQISSVQSAERGPLVTVVNCMSPTGHFILPLPVFPRKYMKPELMNGTPSGSIHVFHHSGWIQSEIFTQWFLHFNKHTKPTKKKKVLLSRYRTGTIHTQGAWRSLL